MCLRFVFLLITRLAAGLRLSRREEAWQTAKIFIPSRLPAAYHRTHGIRYFHGCYSLCDDQLCGVVAPLRAVTTPRPRPPRPAIQEGQRDPPNRQFREILRQPAGQ